MVISKEILTFRWENENFFELKCKEDELTDIVVIHIDENACIQDLWPHVESVCKSFISKRLELMGNQMKVRG